MISLYLSLGILEVPLVSVGIENLNPSAVGWARIGSRKQQLGSYFLLHAIAVTADAPRAETWGSCLWFLCGIITPKAKDFMSAYPIEFNTAH